MNARLSAVAAGIAVGAMCAALLGIPQVRELEEQVGLRWLFNLRGPVDPPEQAVIVVMNQEAASLRGRSVLSGADGSNGFSGPFSGRSAIGLKTQRSIPHILIVDPVDLEDRRLFAEQQYS